MNDPIRLIDEAPTSDFSSALRVERELAARLDGAALKGKVLANVALGAVPSALRVTASTWTSAALPAVLAGLVGVGVGVGGTLAIVDRAPAPATPTESVIERAAAPVDVPTAPPPVVSPTSPPREVPKEAAAPTRPARRVEPESTATGSTLVDETRRYERAETALRDGRPAVAIDELNGYLRLYPTGSLRNEVRLTLLEALFEAERYADARDLAESLAKDADLADRRGEITRLLAKARRKMAQ